MVSHLWVVGPSVGGPEIRSKQLGRKSGGGI